MPNSLDDHAELLKGLSDRSRESLQAAWPEAVRVLSPRGADNYLKGVAGIHALGRGDSLTEAWIEKVPMVVAEVGEDVVSEMATAVMKLASKTSGAVIERLLATAPTAAGRLGDPDLFLDYLRFVGTLVARAPRGVRPMLDRLEDLFQSLTLGGLRRWAMWGAHAHRTDFEAQVRYFSLTSRESLAVLQKERRGTLLVDVQRRINMYLRALWGRDFFMRPTSGDFESREGYRPYIEDYQFHLPDAYDDVVMPDGRRLPGVELYRAAAAHCAAHMVETREPMSAEALSPVQIAVISVIEDARVEALSVQRFPGLASLWQPFHQTRPDQNTTTGDFLGRLARALLDPAHEDDDPWIAAGREQFAAAIAGGRLGDNHMSWDIGVGLAHGLVERRLPFHPHRDIADVPYRDDNRYIWSFESFDPERAAVAGREPRQVRRYVSLMEMVNTLDTELAGDEADEIWVLPTEFYLDQEGVTINSLEGREPVPDPFHYAEWDYQIQLERPAWTTVNERRAAPGDTGLIERIVAAHRREINRMKFVLDALQPEGVQRVRRLEDGDDIDLNAAIFSLTDVRLGLPPDPRIMMRTVRRTRDFSILVLLDLSESTNEKVPRRDYSVLDLTREACVLLADAISRVGDPFAIHGFCSDGRHQVDYYRFKDFEEPWSEAPQARLAGMTGQLSTRMGAAIRHAGHHLRQQHSARRLLIVITDGEPADIDVRDPQYLRQDARKAVEEVGRSGITTYCISLDPRADAYVSRIFGQKHYTVVDHVHRLPEKLPLLYAGLTR